MAQPIELASGAISPTDRLTVELSKPADMPAKVVIRWPTMPSVTDPKQFPAVASAAMRILANAVTKLAAFRASE